MLTVSQVIREGMQAYDAAKYCEPMKDNPYEVPDRVIYADYKPVYNRYSRRYMQVKCKVRVAINYNEVWQIGWNLAEYLEGKAV